jgi:hypothetical protein
MALDTLTRSKTFSPEMLNRLFGLAHALPLGILISHEVPSLVVDPVVSADQLRPSGDA